MTSKLRISKSGRITIPKAIRDTLGLIPGSPVELDVCDGQLIVTRAVEFTPGRGEELVRHLRGAATGGMSTDEVLEMMRGKRR
ncbi:AbrB/MazE/SpoVT family DNA-binding domain-containing protein [bacterium]|nr:AbrB/MazE/SpoVT family DNA-binding domain-containing protein [bacterium]